MPRFGKAEGDVPLAERLGEWQTSKDPRVFKLILSPEFGERIDLPSSHAISCAILKNAWVCRWSGTQLYTSTRSIPMFILHYAAGLTATNYASTRS